MKANVIGAIVGLLAFFSHLPGAVSLCTAVVATVFVCYFFKLKTPSRSALAAVVIVLIQEEAENTARAATERMLCVIAGCVVGLAVTFLFSAFSARGSGSDSSGE